MGNCVVANFAETEQVMLHYNTHCLATELTIILQNIFQ